MPVGGPYELPLEAVPASVRTARQFFVQVAQDLALDSERVALGEVIVSELVANAVVHAAAGPIVLRAVPAGQHIISIEVTDPSPELPIAHPADRKRPTAHGLSVVAGIAAVWGTERHPGDGKTVWAVLPTV